MLMNAQLDLTANLQRRREKHVERVDVDRAFARVFDRRDAEVRRAALDLVEHLVDRRHRERVYRVTEVLEDGRLRERAFGAEISDLQRLLLREARRHELAKQPHHLLVAQRPVVAVDDLAQHLRLALRAVVLDGLLQPFEDADFLGQPRTLGDQRLNSLVDGVDLAAQRRERVAVADRHGRRECRKCRSTFAAAAARRDFTARLSFWLRLAVRLALGLHERSRGVQASRMGSTRTDRMPSIPRIRSSVASAGCVSRSTSVYESSSREWFSMSAMLMFCAARHVKICATMFGTFLCGIATRFGRVRLSTVSGKLTERVTLPFSRNSRTLSTTMTAQFSSASTVEAPRCGKQMTLGLSSSARVGKSVT